MTMLNVGLFLKESIGTIVGALSGVTVLGQSRLRNSDE